MSEVTYVSLKPSTTIKTQSLRFAPDGGSTIRVPSFTLLFLLGSLVLTHRLRAQDCEWVRRGGNKTVSAVDSDGAGNAYLLTSFSGSASFGPYSFSSLGSTFRSDLCLIKYDKDGAVKWARRIGGHGNDDLGDVTISKYGGYLYVTGTFEQTVRFGTYHGIMTHPLTSRGGKDIFVARYEINSGIFQWAKQAGGASSDVANGIFTEKYGEEVFITGSFSGTATFSTSGTAYTLNSYQNSTDAYYAKYDRDGRFQQARRWGWSGYDYGAAIAVNSWDDDIYVTGTYGGTLSLESGHVLPNNGYSDAFVAKYNQDGSVLWSNSTGSSGTDEGHSIAERFGEIYVSGVFSGTATFGHNTQRYRFSVDGRALKSQLYVVVPEKGSNLY